MSTFAKIFSLLLAVCLTACGLCLAASAAEDEIDPARPCSLSILPHEGYTPITDGDLTLFRVGELDGSGSTLRYVLTGQFAGSDVSLENLGDDDAASAKALADYAEQQHLEGDTREIGDNGARYEGLTVGVYLVIQKNPAEGYYPIEPFLISLPAVEDERYVYDVAAAPKAAPKKGDVSDDSSESSTESSEDLPKTGQLKWPIPVLIISGLVFIVFGLLIALGARRRNSQ